MLSCVRVLIGNCMKVSQMHEVSELSKCVARVNQTP